jgi:hypothetical protein
MTAAHAFAIANDSPFCESRARMKKIEDLLTSEEALHAPSHEIERLMMQHGNELIRDMIQAHYTHRAAQERPVQVVGADGIERDQVRTASRRLETPFGDVTIERRLYQAPGVDGIAPLDAALELPDEHYSYEVRRIAAEESARGSFDEVAELIAKRTGAHVPKRQIEQLTVRAAQDFDAFYSDRLCEPEITDDLLVLSFDGKGIAMRHADLREATRKAAESEPKLHTRLAKGEKPNRKRMAQVATVYSIARWHRTTADVLHGLREDRNDARPRPTHKRVWASAQRTAQGVIDDAFSEAARRDPDHRRRWIVLVDGQRDQIKRVERAARKVGATITIVLDVVHVLEYLWRAAYAFHKDGTPEAEAWVEHQFLKLLGDASGGAIAKSLRGMIKSHGLDAKAAAPVEKAAAYLVKHTRLLHYGRALADGLPIATGVIEGACRYLVQDRMGRTGARWSLTGAEAILRLRALRASGDFDDYWQFHLAKAHERTHASRYANAVIPDPLPPRRPQLKLVK